MTLILDLGMDLHFRQFPTKFSRLKALRKSARRNSRRDLGFFAGVARTILSRVAIATGLVGGTGYYLDQRITEWNENTWGPVKEKIDLFKSITKQGYRDFPEVHKSVYHTLRQTLVPTLPITCLYTDAASFHSL